MSSKAYTISRPIYTTTPVETGISYQRSTGQQIDMTFVHNGAANPANFCIGISTDAELEAGEPFPIVELSYEEARLLRNFLNRPDVGQLLDSVTP